MLRGAVRCTARPPARSSFVRAARHYPRMASSTPSSPPTTGLLATPAASDGQKTSTATDDAYEPLRMQIVIRRDLKTVCVSLASRLSGATDAPGPIPCPRSRTSSGPRAPSSPRVATPRRLSFTSLGPSRPSKSTSIGSSRCTRCAQRLLTSGVTLLSP
jgi:hypothetical protein